MNLAGGRVLFQIHCQTSTSGSELGRRQGRLPRSLPEAEVLPFSAWAEWTRGAITWGGQAQNIITPITYMSLVYENYANARDSPSPVTFLRFGWLPLSHLPSSGIHITSRGKSGGETQWWGKRRENRKEAKISGGEGRERAIHLIPQQGSL